MWRSAQSRISGPSLSRKNRLSAVNEAKIARPASASMPVPSPLVSAWNAALTVELASWAVSLAELALTPACSSQSRPLSTAAWRLLSSCCAWLAMPSSTANASAPPATRSAKNTIAAAAARGTCRASLRTTGDSTAAMIVAVTTGTTMVSISASSHTAPARKAVTPTSSHAIAPRSRSHEGGAKTPLRSLGSTSGGAPLASSE
jgi:hypothetical protein